MATLFGLPECDVLTDLVLHGQTAGWNERVIASVEDQGGHLHARQARLRAGARPLVIGVSEAMQRRCEHIVKGIQCVGGQQLLWVKQARELG